MYNITKDEALSLLQKMRQIRQASGEMISFLEHMMQLQDEERKSDDEPSDPDAYLHSWAQHPDHPIGRRTMEEIVGQIKPKEANTDEGN